MTWSWIFTGFRVASGLLLLPVLVRALSQTDLGMYYVFWGLTSFLGVLDNSFALNIGRFVNYAMGGAKKILPQGVDFSDSQPEPNAPLLWQLLSATQALYGWLAIGVLALLGMAGTLIVSLRVAETTTPAHTWLAWAATLLAASVEVYSGWWNVFLRNLNQVATSARILVAVYGARLIIAMALLLCGARLMALPIAALCSSLLHRQLARHWCLKAMPRSPSPNSKWDSAELLRLIWPNSWRAGLQLLSNYFCANSLAVLCLTTLGLAANAQYGLSLQIVAIVQGMSAVWIQVKWPWIGQLRAKQELSEVRRLLADRIHLQNGTFFLLSVGALLFAQWLLDLWGANKQVLPVALLSLLALNSFLEMQFSTWTILLSTENRIPSLWATVVTNLSSVVLAVVLIKLASVGLTALVLAPLVSGCLFNYWYWLGAGAKSLNTTWWWFTFRRPS